VRIHCLAGKEEGEDTQKLKKKPKPFSDPLILVSGFFEGPNPRFEKCPGFL